jgi:hypothetical protein
VPKTNKNQKESVIKNIESGQQKLNPELAEKFEETFGISGWWLLTGRGEMLTNNVNSIQIIGDNNNLIGNGNITITIKKDNISGEENEVKLLCSLIKFAPKPFIKKIIEKLEKLKEVSEI